MNDKRKILITGASGLLGSSLAVYFSRADTVLGLYGRNRVTIPGVELKGIDITDAAAVRRVVREFEPDVVFHCAAITDIDRCEREQDLAYRVNTLGTRNVVRALKGLRAQLVHVSTDAVYSGETGGHKETDRLTPRNFYARTKVLAEKEALKHKDTIVVRTSFYGWDMISRDKKSLAEVVLEQLRTGKRFSGFTDVHTGIIYTFDLARLMEAAITRRLSGIYNMVCRTFTTKYDFAVKIARKFGLDETLIEPISVDHSHLTAKRSKKLTLDISKIAGALKTRIPSFDASLDHYFRDLKKGLALRYQSAQAGAVFPKLDMIPYGRQSIGEDDIAAVVEVLKSRNLTQGPKVSEFEAALCRVTGARFAVAVNSGTSALHIACRAMDLSAGEEAVTSPNTFVATANCVVYCGARPVFADIDPRTYNLDPVSVEARMTLRTRAVIPVHFAGQSCDMERLRAVVAAAERTFGHKIYILEDASHALGSFYKGEPVGCCRFSDMAVMSFHPVKHVTTGEGGVVLTNNEVLYKKLKTLRSHGITSIPEEFVSPAEAFEKDSGEEILRPWYYEQTDLGYNYRLTDIQCALGISQMKKLPVFVARRREIVDFYNERFREVPEIKTPCESADNRSNFHLYVLLFDFERMGLSRARLMQQLRRDGILTQVHYIPVHTQPFYRSQFGTNWGDCPKAEEYYRKCVSLPLYPSLSLVEARRVVKKVKETMTACLIKR